MGVVDMVGHRNERRLGHRHVFGISAIGLVAEDVVLRAVIVLSGQALRTTAATEPGLQHHALADEGARTIRIGHLARDVRA